MTTAPVWDENYKEWWEDWSTVSFKPNFWWRLKYLFKPHDIMFCWGNDQWFTVGFEDQWYFAIGGVPTSERNRKI